MLQPPLHVCCCRWSGERIQDLDEGMKMGECYSPPVVEFARGVWNQLVKAGVMKKANVETKARNSSHFNSLVGSINVST